MELAVGAVLTKSDKIELWPLELKEKAKRFVEDLSIQVIVVGVVMALLLIAIGLNIQLGANHKKMAALNFEQRIFVSQLEAMRSTLVANQILNVHPYWEDVLREISNTIEPGLYVTECSMQNDKGNFKGVILKSARG